jgi:hypothetical protein
MATLYQRNGQYYLNYVINGRRVRKSVGPNKCEADILLKELRYKLFKGDIKPKEFSTTVYPNPFNLSVNISFDLPVSVNVKIDIFNVLGRKVETLTGRYHEAGTYTIEWEASNQASGIYFYRIEAGEFTETKKMTLLK